MKRNILNKRIMACFTLLGMCITNSIAHEVEGDESGYSPEIQFHVVEISDNDTLSVRSGAGTNNKKIDELSHDAEGIQVLKCTNISAENEWCKIHYMTNKKHGTGWVSAKYLSSKEVTKSHYESGKLKNITSEEGAFSKTTGYYETGQISIIYNMAEGEYDGPYKLFYESGTLMYDALMESGSFKGVAKMYFQSGKPQMTIHYDEETRQPMFAYIYKENGTEKKVTEKDQLEMINGWFFEKKEKFEEDFIY